MNCGVYCAVEYLKQLKISSKVLELIVKELEQRLVEGLSIYDLLQVLNKYGYHLAAYHSRFKAFKTPYIIYLRRQKHYLLVTKENEQYYVWDQKIGKQKVKPFILRLIYQGIVILNST